MDRPSRLSSSKSCHERRFTGQARDKAGFNIQKLDELSDDNKKVPRDEQGNFVLTRGRSY
jgi:hypothetical protein